MKRLLMFAVTVGFAAALSGCYPYPYTFYPYGYYGYGPPPAYPAPPPYAPGEGGPRPSGH